MTVGSMLNGSEPEMVPHRRRKKGEVWPGFKHFAWTSSFRMTPQIRIL
jgi:hypothetical protein